MRIQLKLSPNFKPVPFSHLHELNGALHKWLGPNEVHGELSLYGFGWLRGGERIGRSLNFPNGATWNLSFFDSENAWSMVRGILADPYWNYGMKVEQALKEPYPRFGETSRFLIDGAVMLRKRRPDGTRQYLLWDDEEANQALTRIFRKKMQTAGFSGEHLASEMRFAPELGQARTKLVGYRKIKHRSSECPIEVIGTPEAAQFAWLTGAGESTGSGFGAFF